MTTARNPATEGHPRPRILAISFSPIHTDARVLRQLSVLAELGEVTTLGYGPQPVHARRHLEVTMGTASLPQTPMGVLRLALRLHRSLPLTAPGERAGMRLLADEHPYDLVVANDARALPLAMFAARGAPVWADLHEWAPEENTTSLPWRLLVKPYMDALCRRYLPRSAATSTVSGSIAELYRERYGVTPIVIRNAGPYRELSPSTPVPGKVRLVHSGVAIPERNIEGLIDAVDQLGQRFSLDLYLIGTEHYLESLRRRAAGVSGVMIHPPTTPAELPGTLNRYDFGVYILPLRTLNHRLMLPNKFFDFVQARLGIVMSPALETARLIETHGLGPRLDAGTPDALVQTLAAITDGDVARYKESADRAARELNSAADIEAMRTLIARLLNTPPARQDPVRVVIASRIFTPEPAAASFMLEAIARKLAEAGHQVTVLTTKAPRGTEAHDPDGVEVRRAPVWRDRSGYVRGYVSYLSFDIPLFFRLLVGRRADIYLVEPPPTTGAVVRLAARLRRRPYVYEAADLWADAARMVTRSRFVLGALRRVEGFGMRGARRLFAISNGLVSRVRELGISTPATVVGFGADPAFRYEMTTIPLSVQNPYFIYAGSYSEWHGAGIFVEAYARIRAEYPGARLLFIGHGSERDELIAWCEANEVTGVEFREPVEPETLNPLLGGACAALASVRPGTGYDYAFATKVYASAAAGCPVIFAGVGPTSEFIASAAHLGAGVAVGYDVDAVTDAMRRALQQPLPPADRAKLSAWARSKHSIDACADLVAREIAWTAHP